MLYWAIGNSRNLYPHTACPNSNDFYFVLPKMLSLFFDQQQYDAGSISSSRSSDARIIACHAYSTKRYCLVCCLARLCVHSIDIDQRQLQNNTCMNEWCSLPLTRHYYVYICTNARIWKWHYAKQKCGTAAIHRWWESRAIQSKFCLVRGAALPHNLLQWECPKLHVPADMQTACIYTMYVLCIRETIMFLINANA